MRRQIVRALHFFLLVFMIFYNIWWIYIHEFCVYKVGTMYIGQNRMRDIKTSDRNIGRSEKLVLMFWCRYLENQVLTMSALVSVEPTLASIPESPSEETRPSWVDRPCSDPVDFCLFFCILSCDQGNIYSNTYKIPIVYHTPGKIYLLICQQNDFSICLLRS